MHRALLSTAFLAVLSLTGIGLGAQKSDAKAAIEAGNKRFVAAAAKGDAAGIAAVYTVDAIAFPPNEPVVKGRAAIQKMWKGVLDAGITNVQLATTLVEASGDLAYEDGTYVMKDKAGKVADRGKYSVTWKRVNGMWLLHRDIWNTDLPASK
jgi:ketosteroid isomerase-like protein